MSYDRDGWEKQDSRVGGLYRRGDMEIRIFGALRMKIEVHDLSLGTTVKPGIWSDLETWEDAVKLADAYLARRKRFIQSSMTLS